jgi:tetratricopeptide (TPR) repeat protein
VTSSGIKRIRRQQLLREAEGYLDLVQITGDPTLAPLAVRERLANRALDALERLAQWEWPAHAAYLKGQALRTLDRFQEALEPLKDAAERSPGDINIWLALGWCYKRTGRLDLAIESLEEALEIDPDQAIIHYNLACYWSLASNKRQAINYLAQALRMDANFRNLIARESDFDPIRSDPGFQALTSVIV